MLNLGTVRPGSTILIPFHAFDSNDPSASVIISAFALADIGIYKGLSMTERGSTLGVVLLDTDGINIDGATGIHGFSIDLSSNATAGFYAAGSSYYVTVGPITIDGATVNFVSVMFNIGYPDAILNTTIGTRTSATVLVLASGPADDDALNGCTCLVHDVASAVQIAIGYVLDYDGGSTTVTLAADPGVFASAAPDNISFFMPANVEAWNRVPLAATNPLPNAAADGAGGLPISDAGGLDMDVIADSFNGLVKISQDVAATLVDTSVIGALGAGLTDLGGMSTGMKGEVAAEAGNAIVNFKLDHLVFAADGDDPVNNSIIAKMVSKAATADWSDFVNTTDSLQAIRDRGDAAWTTGGGTGLTALATGTAQSGTASTIVLAASAAFADNVLNGNTINIHAGTGAGQSRVILSNTLADDTCNVSPNWTTNPSSDSEYEIVQGSTNVAAVNLTAQTAGDLAALIVTADAAIDVAVADLANGTDGLGALKTLIDTVNSDLANGTDGLGALKTLIDIVNTDLSNGTDGLGALKTLIDALNDYDPTAAMPSESYATKGSIPSPNQALLEILQRDGEMSNAGTTRTTKKIDGTTAAMTHTYDDAADPTSVTRAT